MPSLSRSKWHSANQGERPNTAGLEHISIDGIRDILGDICNRAYFGNERIVITRYGADAAVVIGLRDFARLLRADAAETDLPAASGE